MYQFVYPKYHTVIKSQIFILYLFAQIQINAQIALIPFPCSNWFIFQFLALDLCCSHLLFYISIEAFIAKSVLIQIILCICWLSKDRFNISQALFKYLQFHNLGL